MPNSQPKGLLEQQQKQQNKKKKEKHKQTLNDCDLTNRMLKKETGRRTETQMELHLATNLPITYSRQHKQCNNKHLEL